MKLLLFDVDLTLINTGGVGRKAMMRAFEELFGGSNGLKKVSFAGRTDVAIFKDGLKNRGVEWSLDKETEFRSRYLNYLQAEIEKPNPSKHVEPGIPELLSLLAERNDVTLALLTGNWREGAKIKLSHFDLFHFFHFGAFADDSEFREELPGIAYDRFRGITDSDISSKNVYVIGDTPRDVACARPFGATAIAVATGLFSYSELEEAEPDHLFRDLSNPHEFMHVIE